MGLFHYEIIPNTLMRERLLARRQIPKKRQACIFDGDDTLWHTMPLYEAAKDSFSALLQEFGICPEQSIQELDTIDMQKVPLLGFSRERFPSSLVDAYRALLSKRSVVTSQSVEKRLRQLGDSVFTGKAPLVNGARTVISALQDFYLVLLTKGELQVQRRRIEQSHLASKFDEIIIVPNKNKELFQHIISTKQIDAKRSWSIGNSLKSDIIPALESGLQAIWIPAKTWGYEELPEHVQHSRLIVCHKLQDILEVILSKT